MKLSTAACAASAVMALSAAILGAGGLVPARAAVVTCPTVTPVTDVVTPAPAPGVNWSGCDLTLANLHGADLDHADLSGANLSSADLTTANLSGANFTGANLNDANAGGAQIVNVNFTGANLGWFMAWDIVDSDLQGTDISGANFGYEGILSHVRSGGVTDYYGAPYLPDGWRLDKGFLVGPGADFSGLNFTNGSVPVPSLHLTNLSGSVFSAADMAGLDLSQDTLTGGQFAGTNLAGANLYADNLAGSYLQGADLSGTNLGGVESGGITGKPAKLPAHWMLEDGYLLGPTAGLGSADLAGANLTGADLEHANLYLATLDHANLTNVDLRGAPLDLVDVTGAIWSNTICPDGANSDDAGGTCVNNSDDLAPVAAPALSGLSRNGWYTTVTITWNWTDGNATINAAKCPQTTTSAVEGKPATITGTCLNTLGGVGTAQVTADIENKGPQVAVTGVAANHVYAVGHVPAAGCRTTDSLSGVARNATVTLATTGSHGTGAFTATCSGAVNKAGIGQGAPVRVSYTVAYGLSGFVAPKNGATVARSTRPATVRFTLGGISATRAASLAAAGDVRVTLSGPGISTVTARAAWDARSGTFLAAVPVTAKAGQYLLTVLENVGTGFVTVPALGPAVNPETIKLH